MANNPVMSRNPYFNAQAATPNAYPTTGQGVPQAGSFQGQTGYDQFSQAQPEAQQQFQQYWQPLATLQQSFEQELSLLGAQLSQEVLALAVSFAEKMIGEVVRHDPAVLREPEAGGLDRMMAGGIVRQVTIAPELPGAMAAIEPGRGIHSSSDLTKASESSLMTPSRSRTISFMPHATFAQ